MPEHPTSEPGSLNRSSAARSFLPDEPGEAEAVEESNLAELAALFAANQGGSFSADLALDVVLHEIAEQACLATGATGAAIVLGRQGEMVCRASSGATAPALGARVDSVVSITGECLRSLEVQSCDDAQTDPRADFEAARQLGIRSVMVLPLLRDSNLVGLFEVFSTRAAAFGERDQRTLEALARRVIKNLETADQPAKTALEPPLFVMPAAVLENTEAEPLLVSEQLAEGPGKSDARGVKILTWGLGLAVLGCAILLGTVAIKRLSGHEATRARSAKPSSSAPHGTTFESAQATPSSIGRSSAGNSAMTDPSAGDKNAVTSPASAGFPSPTVNSRKAETRDSVLPPGGLRVFENGREVFRMPPAPGQTEPPENHETSGVQRAASIENEPTMELSSAAAESSLLHRVEPDYPEEALQQKVQGAVVLDIHISKEGAVQDLKLVSGHPLLAQAAMNAVKQWRFKPRKVNGHAAEMQTKITMNFKLPS